MIYQASERSGTLVDEKAIEERSPKMEKDIEEGSLPEPLAKETLDLKPLRRVNSSRSRSRRPSLSRRLSRSPDGGQGCRCCSQVESPTDSNDSADAREKPFEVQFEGDDDPMNPRNLLTFRRWMIVIIVSMSSTCV